MNYKLILPIIGGATFIFGSSVEAGNIKNLNLLAPDACRIFAIKAGGSKVEYALPPYGKSVKGIPLRKYKSIRVDRKPSIMSSERMVSTCEVPSLKGTSKTLIVEHSTITLTDDQTEIGGVGCKVKNLISKSALHNN